MKIFTSKEALGLALCSSRASHLRRTNLLVCDLFTSFEPEDHAAIAHKTSDEHI